MFSVFSIMTGYQALSLREELQGWKSEGGEGGSKEQGDKEV
jgi:hypothetical protein